MPPRVRKPTGDTLPTEIKIERRRIETLLPDPTNARRHSERNIQAIQAAYRRFGQQKPIVIDAKNIVVAGNGQLEAAKREGWDWIECKVFEGSTADARAYALADNRTGELAEWDQEVLMETLESLDPALQLDAGWSAKELEQLLSSDTAGAAGDATGDAGPEVWGVIVTCESEEQQRQLMTQLDDEGFTVRAMIQ